MTYPGTKLQILGVKGEYNKKRKLTWQFYRKKLALSEKLLGIREIEKGKFLVVVYRELNNDGFIITAFLTRRIKSLNRRKQIWPK